MSKGIQAVRGMNDILPGRSEIWLGLESTVRSVLTGYGYREIRIPVLEKTELFRRSIGEVTDIVEKEMYTFDDRSNDSVTLRPEGTAGCVRACVEHGLLHNQTARLWYGGPMFRYERPQKGRYRQFYQIGAEAFGMSGPDIDAELIAVSSRTWRRLNLNRVRLQINSIGEPEARASYRQALRQYFGRYHDALDADSQRRLNTNPLRILDSKNPELQEIIREAPVMLDYLDPASEDHFRRLCELLDAANIPYEINPRLVRGLDYYNRTVFEWLTDELGAQGAICAGGRYDGLVAQVGGRATPAIGFAMGLDRLVELLSVRQYAGLDTRPHAYLVIVGGAAEIAGVRLAEQVREQFPRLKLQTNCGGGGFKSQLKRADRSGANVAIIIGDEEVNSGTVAVKFLRGEDPQVSVERSALGEFLDRNATVFPDC
jgi:histidyl-tRNA synthetase